MFNGKVFGSVFDPYPLSLAPMLANNPKKGGTSHPSDFTEHG